MRFHRPPPTCTHNFETCLHKNHCHLVLRPVTRPLQYFALLCLPITNSHLITPYLILSNPYILSSPIDISERFVDNVAESDIFYRLVSPGALHCSLHVFVSILRNGLPDIFSFRTDFVTTLEPLILREFLRQPKIPHLINIQMKDTYTGIPHF